MSKVTRYFKKKLSVTSTEAEYKFPAVSNVNIYNAGTDDVLIEVDNVLDTDSFLLGAGMSIAIQMSPISLSYKAVASTATLYLMGIKSIKS